MRPRPERVERLRPARSTLGRCRACGRPAHRDELGWSHLGVDDEAACLATAAPGTARFRPDRLDDVAVAVLAAVAVAVIAATLARTLMAAPGPWALGLGALLAVPVYLAARAGQSLRSDHHQQRNRARG